MNNLITTYFSKMKDIPDDYNKIVITRFPPKWLEIDKSKKIHLFQSFAPSKEILLQYKKDGDWGDYVEKFNHYMKYCAEFKRIAATMSKNINERNSKYALICFEKDGEHCHRQLVANYFKDVHKIEWEEM